MQKSVDIEKLIELAVVEVGVPPGLRERAKDNMRRLIGEKGHLALEQRIAEAQEARRAAARYLSGGDIAADAMSNDVQANEQRLWSIVEKHVQSRAELQHREWAKAYREASRSIKAIDSFSIFENRHIGRIICDQFIGALRIEDFNTESPAMRASVFAEVANLLAIFAKRYNDYGRMATSLNLYREACSTLRASNFEGALLTVQANRANALGGYIHLIQRRFIDKYRNDFEEVASYLTGGGYHADAIGGLDDQTIQILSTDINESRAFFFAHAEARRELLFTALPADSSIENEAYRLAY